ncbi:MAG TPA: hypothetical protein VF615_16445 [Longimicrobiaceae bacterium]|jgi:hypothetical protein
MRPAQIEAWVLSIIDRIARSEPLEDARIELKAEWPDTIKAARRIAGHANSARGENILWIIGVDEIRGIVGATANDLAQWFQQVRSHFDGLPPDMLDLIIPVGSTTVVALYFDTARAPFVVYNPVRNQAGAGPVELEVPWREGTRVRSARREDLIRLLVPLQALPIVELLDGYVRISSSGQGNQKIPVWDCDVRLYITPRTQDRVFIPKHNVEFLLEASDLQTTFYHLKLEPPMRYRRGPGLFSEGEPLSLTIGATSSEVLIDGPGVLHLKAHQRAESIDFEKILEIIARVNIRPSLAERAIAIEGNFRKTDDSKLQWDAVKSFGSQIE